MSLDPNSPQSELPPPAPPAFPPAAYPPQPPIGYAPTGMQYGQAMASSLEGPVKVLGICYIILGCLGLIGALVIVALVPLMISTAQQQNPGQAAIPAVIFSVMAIIVGLIAGVLPLVTGIGLLRRATWARGLAIASGILQLLGFPIGTTLGIFTLYYMLRGGAKEAYDALSGQSRRY